ncbi:MAG: translation elongation factor 4 [Candidatus Gracilibacteria bacterium]|jgi:GTP-binding protein LepA
MEHRNIRNFCIIAHIDHGKSTLADRFLEVTNTVSKREMKHDQLLDTMDIEQERGITIKLQPVRMDYEYNGEKYILNLIDTPGHVDFSYEVSRSLAACEGAILVVDATQGIEAQTLANCYMAIDHNLEIVPVLNKIDLPSADVPRRAQEIEDALGIDKNEVLAISAKDGTNVEELLRRVIEKVPPPSVKVDDEDELKALIFDSIYDSYKGVVVFVRLMSGCVKRGDKVYLLNTKTLIDVIEVGYFKPKYLPCEMLHSGEVGYIVTGLKSVVEAKVGDTVWAAGKSEIDMLKAIPLPGYHVVKPFVFAGVYCTDADDYPLLRDALDKLKLNDSALSFGPESSMALGHGFRCGFLGLLHMEIVQERLEREYNLDLIVTAPSVSYVVMMNDGSEKAISSPAELPDPVYYNKIKEPWVKVEILTPKEHVGALMTLCSDRRGISKDMQFLDQSRVIMIFEMPLANIVVDFYDRLKSVSSGYASMNYEYLDYREEDLVKLDIMVAGEKVDALSLILHRKEAFYVGQDLTKRLKEIIPRAQFVIPIQAAIGAKILARETIAAYRKDVTGYLYGGDVSRKRKLLEKQKKGKKRMKMMGKVSLPQEAFLAILKRDSN